MTPEQQKALALANARQRAAAAQPAPAAPSADPKSRVRKMADGTLAYSDGTYSTSDPKQVARIMAGEDPALVARTSGVTTGGNFFRQALQGLTFGFGDEAVAAGASALGPNSYETELERERARVDTGAAEAPVSSIAANVGGSIASSLVGGGLVADGAKRVAAATGLDAMLGPLLSAVMSRVPAVAQKAAAGAGLGATDAAVYGFGTGEGGFSERVDNAGDNALVGALFGGAIPVAQAAIRPVGRGVMNLASAPFSSQANPANAGRAVEKAMSRANMTSDDVAAALQQAASEGQPMFTIADAVGDPARGILNGVMRQPGPAKNEGAEFLMQRQAGQGERLSRFLSEALDAPDTAAARIAAIEKARDEAADVAFGQARSAAAPVDVRGVLSAIDARITPMQGVGANVDPGPIDKSLAGLRKRLAAVDPTSGNPVELSDFNRVYALRREVADAASSAYTSGQGELGKELRAVRDALDTALEGASPDYSAAMSAYRSASDNVRAVEAGQAATSGRVRSDDVLSAIQDLPPEQLPNYRVGYADPTIARVEAAAPGVNKARPLTSDKATAELGALATDPALLSRRVERENEMFRTGGRVMGGSATVENLGDVTDAARQTATLAGQAMINPVWAARRFAGNVADVVLNGVRGENEATRAAISRAMLSNDVQGALAPLFASRQRVDRAMGDAEFLARIYGNRAVEQQEAQ